LKQDGSRLFPVALHRALGNTVQRGDFLEGIAAEVLQIDDLCEPRITKGKRVDRLGELRDSPAVVAPSATSVCCVPGVGGMDSMKGLLRYDSIARVCATALGMAICRSGAALMSTPRFLKESLARLPSG
jgi:hypothetical protein